MYFQLSTGASNPFDQDFTLYWGILGLLMALYFFVLFVKYYCLNILVLNSNQEMHEQMVNGIVRSPGHFFDTTPSGTLINKFSNDLGILDNTLSTAMVEMLEGPALSLVALVNICLIDVYLIPPTVIIVTIVILFFSYAQPVIIQSKQKDLKNKSPIFNFYS